VVTDSETKTAKYRHHHHHFICSVKCKNTVENKKKQENTEQGEPGS